MATPGTLPDTPNADGSKRLSQFFTSMGHAAGINKMVHDISEAWKRLGTGSSTPARGKGLVASGTGTSAWDSIARKNRLINGDMRVKQRVTLGSADNTYTLDRWRVLMEAANACVVTQETSNVPSYGSKRAMKLTAGSGNNNKFAGFQVLEFLDCADLRGKKASVQASLEATAGIATVKMGVLEWTGTADAVSGDPISSWGADGVTPTLAANWAFLNTPANLSVATSDAIYRVENVAVGASANNLAVLIWSDDKSTTQTTDFLIVTDVQLEEGEVCTEFERRPLNLEEWMCAYYYQKLGGAAAGDYIGVGPSFSTSQAIISVPYRREMRTNPVVTYPTVGNLQLDNAAGGSTVLTAISTQFGPFRNSLQALVTRTGTWTPSSGVAATMYSTNTSGFIELNAEL